MLETPVPPILEWDVDEAGNLVNVTVEREDIMAETPEVNPSTEEGDVNVTVEAPEPEQQDDGNGAEQNTDDQA